MCGCKDGVLVVSTDGVLVGDTDLSFDMRTKKI